MKHLIIVAVLGFLAWQGYAKYEPSHAERIVSSSPVAQVTPRTATFSCDGRTYCSQMTSCAEATFFLQNCPGVKMDGNHDGVPCERQWCK